MAKAAPEVKNEGSSVLPVPGPVIEHHLLTLAAPMKEWVGSGNFPPVLLLTGSSGVGKRSIAYFLSQWILCQRNSLNASPSQEDDQTIDLFGGGGVPATPEPNHSPEACTRPCGECGACRRALQANWVDFAEITSDPDESDSLKIDQFRKLKSSQGFGAHEGKHRIFLIPNADRMTLQAANSMLKLLEEPPRGWIFMLTASDPALLLPTIVSRCQVLRLRPFAKEKLQEILGLSGVPADRRALCAELGQGSWGRALRIADESFWTQRGNILELLRDPTGGISPLIDWAATDPSHFDLLVDQVEYLLSDLIRWSLQSQTPEAYGWVNSDARNALADHAQRALKALGSAARARDFWIERAARIARARTEALAPLNRKILLQDLLLPWLQITR